MRKELLDAYLFFTLDILRILAEHWNMDYNHEMPYYTPSLVPHKNLFDPFTYNYYSPLKKTLIRKESQK